MSALDDFNRELADKHLLGFWNAGNIAETYEPKASHEPCIWRWNDVYDGLMKTSKPREHIDWQAWSIFVPPAMWCHEHFNTSVEPVRFLAFHPPAMLAYHGWSGESEHFIGMGPNQIEYDDEDPAIRAALEAELAKNHLTSKMKPELYRKY